MSYGFASCENGESRDSGTMKRTAIILVMFGTLVTGTLDARADSGNPFGFETNKHPLEYEYCKKEPGLYRGHGYKCSSAPRPHPDLAEYALQFVEDVGLCLIVGLPRHNIFDPSIGDFFPNKNETMVTADGLFGINFGGFYSQIVKKYGSPTSRQKIDSGLIEMLNPEIYSWASEEGFKGLGDVKEIELFRRNLPDPDTRASLRVSFWLITSDACLKEIDDKADHAF